VSAGQGEPPFPCIGPKRAVGQRLRLSRDVAGVCLRRVCPRCFGTSHPSTQTCTGSTGPPLGSRIAISIDQIHRAAGRGEDHSPAGTVAQLRGSGIRDIGIGRLVQQSSTAGTHREYPASRSRGKLLRSSGQIRYGRVTKTNQPPVNPAGFSSSHFIAVGKLWDDQNDPE
jgi:hypothetical protein